jgi:hypothetical protein
MMGCEAGQDPTVQNQCLNCYLHAGFEVSIAVLINMPKPVLFITRASLVVF